MGELIYAILLGCSLDPTTTYTSAEQNQPKTFDVAVETDISYRTDKDADPERHKLDIYTPKGPKDFPVLMFVHGGAWKSGSKGLYGALGKTFAGQGIGTVLINYRLSKSDNAVKHPDHIKDVASAFAWVHANIGKYGGRKDRIFIAGHSAGGHLVSLLATDEQYLKEHKLGVENIRGVMALSGVYEILPLIPIFTQPFGQDAKICKAASPIHHVHEKSPPFLIVYADGDYPTCDRMSEAFCKKLGENKCEAKVLEVKNRGHISIMVQLALSPTDPCTKEMLDFIAKHSEWKRGATMMATTPVPAPEPKARPTQEEEHKKLLGTWEFKPSGKTGKDGKENITVVSLEVRQKDAWLFITAQEENGEKYFRSGTFDYTLEEKGKDRVIKLTPRLGTDKATTTYRFDGESLKLEGGELLWLKLTGEWTRTKSK